MAPPYHADQIGSLMRPQALLTARAHLQDSSHIYDTISEATIHEAEQNAIDWAVQKQLDLGIRPICSGEYGRHIFYGGFFETLEGMTLHPELPIPDAFRTDFPTTTKIASMGINTRPGIVCTGPVRWKGSAYMAEWKMLRRSLPEEKWKECKITMPAPSFEHIQLKSGTAVTKESGYANDEAFFADLAKAYAAEIKALYAEGLRNIQIDDPNMTYFCSQQFLDGCKKDGTDTDALLDLYLEAQNNLLREVRELEGLQTGVHLCRGNFGSRHFVSGSYDKIAQKLFNDTLYDTFYLEFDDRERQGSFEPLQHLPRGKSVVLGLVSTKTVAMERKEELKKLMMDAAEIVAVGQGVSKEEALGSLALSPQCGFSSSSLGHGEGMTMEKMWEKLCLVSSTAKEVWQDA
ncbi:hypothetical protein B0A50_06671 [Salinomyces thailandicus]|uniref:Cobalamin-independent methionine synthase MetE C-terminal/archaeal domain-containing protein n=1 Tax=Salinomyces thailandicus TaxID=706561 RepID=A0A4U0TR04_9PEZI|nr:hypothetical protein B0A50_06671 [Salinomyces thailandica]